METKDYNALSHDEQIDVIEQLAEFLNQDAKVLRSAGRFFNDEQKELYFKGVAILAYFPQCRMFYNVAKNASGNYDQYANTLMHQLTLMSNEIASAMQVSTINGETAIYAGQSQSLRRGRPTAAESEQREKEKKANEKAQAIARMTGMKIATTESMPVAERESDTSRRKKEEENLFDAAVAEQVKTNDAGEDNVPQFDKSELKALREYNFMYPESLGIQVKSVKDLRAEQAHHWEKAKLLMETGADEWEIAEHTEKAKALNDKLVRIFAEFDKTLALYYVMLTKVNKDYGKFAQKYEKNGGYDVLVSNLQPYYYKLIGEDRQNEEILLERAKVLEEKRKAEEERDPEVEKELHKIRTYFSRKDVMMSQERLNEMRVRRQRAEELGVDSDTLAGYDTVIRKAEEDLGLIQDHDQSNG